MLLAVDAETSGKVYLVGYEGEYGHGVMDGERTEVLSVN
jgi:hypothetical protein